MNSAGTTPWERELVSDDDVTAAALRWTGGSDEVVRVSPLGWGTYNATYRVDFSVRDSVVIRFAPRDERQLRSERHWLRSEYAVAPFLTSLGDSIPRILDADFSHAEVDRDYLVQSLLDGVPAPEMLPQYTKDLWPSYFEQLGHITSRVHSFTNDQWGPACGPLSELWSDAIELSLVDSLRDLQDMRIDRGDVEALMSVVTSNRGVLDHCAPPRLLHGDLWTANILLSPSAPTPLVVGIVDSDRAWWGDPLADWSIYLANQRKSPKERDAFWAGYGMEPREPDDLWRLNLYAGRHIVARRVEAARLGASEGVASTFVELERILQLLPNERLDGRI